MTTIIQLILVLGFMVLVHELGHFAAAKWCGVRVQSFALGFGKRLFGFRHGDTEYRINLLPLGGYVKMAGELPGHENTDNPGDLNNHPRWQRILIALAGPIANLILAFGLMTGAFMLHDQVNPYASGPAITDYISPSTAAAKTGIRTGDTIVRFDTIENPTWEDIFNQAPLNLNRPVAFSFLRDGQRTDTTFVLPFTGGPDKFHVDAALKQGLIPRMQNAPIRIESLPASSPAAHAGLKVNDQIVSVDGIPIRSVPALFWYLQDHQGRPAVLDVLRASSNLHLTATPETGDAGDGATGYHLGFTAAEPAANIQHLSLATSLAASWEFNRKNSLLVVNVLSSMFRRHISVKSLSGPVGIGQAVHHAAAAPGWTPLIATIATISINLGIFNLLPFPILDGGMIFLLLVEGTFRRDLPIQIKKNIYQAAFVCVLLFAVMVIFNDITKLPFFIKLKS
jgi:regulator of sigma E protease